MSDRRWWFAVALAGVAGLAIGTALGANAVRSPARRDPAVQDKAGRTEFAAACLDDVHRAMLSLQNTIAVLGLMYESGWACRSGRCERASATECGPGCESRDEAYCPIPALYGGGALEKPPSCFADVLDCVRLAEQLHNSKVPDLACVKLR